MPGWSRSAAPLATSAGTAAAAAATSRTATTQAERLVEPLSPRPNIVTDYRTPDRLRFGLSPLTTRLHRRLGRRRRHPGHHRDRTLREPLTEPVTYSGYLRLDQLPSAQQPKSSEQRRDALHRHPPDLRAVVQAAAAHEFGKVQAEPRGMAQHTHAMRTLRRTLAILKIVVAQLDVLEGP